MSEKISLDSSGNGSLITFITDYKKIKQKPIYIIPKCLIKFSR